MSEKNEKHEAKYKNIEEEKVIELKEKICENFDNEINNLEEDKNDNFKKMMLSGALSLLYACTTAGCALEKSAFLAFSSFAVGCTFAINTNGYYEDYKLAKFNIASMKVQKNIMINTIEKLAREGNLDFDDIVFSDEEVLVDDIKDLNNLKSYYDDLVHNAQKEDKHKSVDKTVQSQEQDDNKDNDKLDDKDHDSHDDMER